MRWTGVSVRSRRLWLVVCVVALALVGLVKGIPLAQAVVAVRQDYTELRALQSTDLAELAQTGQVARVEALLARTASDLKLLAAEAGPLVGLAPLLSWLPQYGGELGQAPALLDYAVEVSAAGRTALRLSSSLLTRLEAGTTQDRSRVQVLLEILELAQPEIETLETQLGRVMRARERIDAQRLSATFGGLIRKSDPFLQMASPALDAIDLLPDALGSRGMRRYLLIAQNSDELRATGGYISGVGIVEVVGGKITRVDYRDAYRVENHSKPHPWPPQPLIDYMNAEQWVLRDANWSPDFPTSARTVQELYTLNQGERVDGVIAVNLGAVQRLVGALAPIDLPEYGERITGKNVMERMEYYFIARAEEKDYGGWWSHRKDFMAALMEAMVARLNGEGAAADAPKVGRALWESLAAKEILLYLNDPDLAKILHELEWDGALPAVQPGRDVVMVVDSNVGFNKADRRVEREFDYRVELRPGENARASLAVRYRNTNPPSAKPCEIEFKYQANYSEMQNTCYWDYMRLYAPPGSIPTGASSDISARVEVPEAGYSVFSGFLVLPKGGTREIRLEYELPLQMRQDGPSEYQLLWIKQPGAPPARVRVTLLVPPSLTIDQASQVPSARNVSSLQFDLPPDRDAELRVRLVPQSEWPGTAIWGYGLLALGMVAAIWGLWNLRQRSVRTDSTA